jgi:cell division protein FtsL
LFSRIPKNSLATPELAKEEGSAEILRMWVRKDWSRLQVSLATHHDDPAVWGIALADAMRHVAKAYALNGARSENDALVRMKQTFDAEWNAPTDLPEGSLKS